MLNNKFKVVSTSKNNIVVSRLSLMNWVVIANCKNYDQATAVIKNALAVKNDH